MNEKNDFALVPRPPSAVEKAEPGAKRILSGMVADALALARGKPSPRIVVIYDHTDVLKSITSIIKHYAFKDATVLTFDDSEKAWQELSQVDPDLLITDYRMPILSGKEILQRLLDRKATYPIIVTSTFMQTDWLMWVRERVSRGLNVVTHLDQPFDIERLVTALETALKVPRDIARRDEITFFKTRPLKIILVDDEEFVLEAIKLAIRAKFKNATIQSFQDSQKAWQELLREDPDLLITRDKMPGLTGEDIVRHLADRKITYPIVVGGGWPPTKEWVREYIAKNLDLTFLRYPFTVEQLYERLVQVFHCSQWLRNKPQKPEE